MATQMGIHAHMLARWERDERTVGSKERAGYDSILCRQVMILERQESDKARGALATIDLSHRVARTQCCPHLADGGIDRDGHAHHSDAPVLRVAGRIPSLGTPPASRRVLWYAG